MAQDDARDRAALQEASVLIHHLMASRQVSDDPAIAEIGTAMHQYRGNWVGAHCPLRCLGLSERTYRALKHGCHVTEDNPATVGDVIRLWHGGELLGFRNMGPRAVGEVEARLVFAGLDLSQHQH